MREQTAHALRRAMLSDLPATEQRIEELAHGLALLPAQQAEDMKRKESKRIDKLAKISKLREEEEELERYQIVFPRFLRMSDGCGTAGGWRWCARDAPRPRRVCRSMRSGLCGTMPTGRERRPILNRKWRTSMRRKYEFEQDQFFCQSHGLMYGDAECVFP
jgi:hypothetical protein